MTSASVTDFCTSIHDLRQQSQHYATDRDDHVAKARKALTELIEPNRILRAKLSALQQHVEEIQKGLEKLRKDNGQSMSIFFLFLTSIFSATVCNHQEETNYALYVKL